MDKMREYGVHAAHCCAKHGCKYGDEDCPVFNLLIKQKHPCWDCDDEDKEMVMNRPKTTAECATDVTEAIHNLVRTVVKEFIRK